MINLDELKIVNYCHQNCIPLKNIIRLPKEDAFTLAYEMASKNPSTTAFYRFADFENYYALRVEQDKFLYDMFVSLGGNPKEKHPLSFVLLGSDFLNQWFGNGTITKLLLSHIPSEFISFTLGDSGAIYQKTGTVTMLTKDMLYQKINEFEGSLEDFMKEIAEHHYYIEVQLWNDDYLNHIK
jgi:hypothetical protein